ncbi:MAG: DUF3007 family protein [Okeania sp. SIO2G4]|uniref:DUF3007 family protein n=1 Tax=unclassified Okeania TaxID=2634635 RepID=UPI0013BAFA0A|nr:MULTISPECIES: DUF3007 family protein [unclassified Okeania]NEP04283.1 DUF3007 family protein [Okeania sp. SIO4D6]NEP44036.1 DUF3007 family protein [Okeania sp. SIO2H7]NEP70665.1 DUF3007 family protein [Okeania sp. SIO2G5]NEP91910.1 DUF3007 family protein [Okeania sp. SIO2F5]NEQ89333.1 DUF3007 family protein [Okeania sp. SIO2G4]
MRRIEAIGISVGIFAAGGILYLILQVVGVSGVNAGIWTQAVLVGGLVGWLLTYLFRVSNSNMTYNQQLKDYEEAVIQKRLEEMTPEELAQLQAEVEQERAAQNKQE